jgi:S1-C subfamily serine protease
MEAQPEQRSPQMQPQPAPMQIRPQPADGPTRMPQSAVAGGRAGAKGLRGLLIGALLVGVVALGAVATGTVSIPGLGPAASDTQAEQISDQSGLHYIGVTMQALTPDVARSLHLPTSRPEGVVLTRIWKKGPAEASGLRVNDVIIAVDGVPVRGPGTIGTKTRLTAIGDQYQLTVERDGAILSIPVRVEKWLGRTAPCTTVCGG